MPKKRNGPNQSMGAKIGSQVGDFLQKGATALFKSVTGFGDYKVKSNTLLSGASPAVFRGGDRSTVVRHREYVQDITGSTAFSSTSFAVNPGNPTLFPWLAAIAQSYEQYKIHGLIFEYKSTSTDSINSVITALGTVIMATDYNVLNPNFTTKIAMENFEFATSSKPSETMLHPLECDPSQTPTNEYFIAPAGSGGDMRFVNMANFQLATVGMQAVGVIGELWCSFEIELIKPRLSSAVPFGSVFASATMSSPNNTNYLSGYTQYQQVNYAFSNISVTPYTIGFNNLVVGASYSLSFIYSGGATSGLIAPSVQSINGAAQSTTFEPAGGATSMTAGTSTDSKCFTRFAITVSVTSVFITFASGAVLPTTALGSFTFARIS